MCVCDRVFCYPPGHLNVSGAGKDTDALTQAKLVTLGDRIRMVCGKFVDLKRCQQARTVAFRKARERDTMEAHLITIMSFDYNYVLV